MGIGKINIGRNFYNVLSEVNEQDTQAKEEKRIREQIKALKDERNTHNQRIRTIDAQLEKLEKELALLTKNNTQSTASEPKPGTTVYQNYSKNNFIIGDSNRMAVKSIEATISNLGTQNNPFILYGASGSGKTHLAHAFTEELRNTDKSVFHLSAMDFLDRLVFALSNQCEDEFRQEMVECDVLIIDDLQHFVGRFGAQDELYLILNDRIANSKQVIITANEHPKKMDWHSNQLASRLLSGLNVKVELADEIMQTQILSNRMEAAKISISNELLAEAIKNTNGNGWLIEGVAKQLIDMSRQGVEINHASISELS